MEISHIAKQTLQEIPVWCSFDQMQINANLLSPSDLAILHMYIEAVCVHWSISAHIIDPVCYKRNWNDVWLDLHLCVDAVVTCNFSFNEMEESYRWRFITWIYIVSVIMFNVETCCTLILFNMRGFIRPRGMFYSSNTRRLNIIILQIFILGSEKMILFQYTVQLIGGLQHQSSPLPQNVHELSSQSF